MTFLGATRLVTSYSFNFCVFTAVYLDRSHVFGNLGKTVKLKCQRCLKKREGRKFAFKMYFYINLNIKVGVSFHFGNKMVLKTLKRPLGLEN